METYPTEKTTVSCDLDIVSQMLLCFTNSIYIDVQDVYSLEVDLASIAAVKSSSDRRSSLLSLRKIYITIELELQIHIGTADIKPELC